MTKKQVIPIVFSTDGGYIPYLGVALHSLIKHSDPKKDYRISIFYTSLLKEQKKRILSFATPHVHIEFMEITREMAGVDGFSSDNHLTVEATYRFLIPELFPQYEKVLYLDCDMVMLSDVAELLHYDLGEAVMGVASAVTRPDWAVDTCQNLEVEMKDIFNSGVLVIQTKRFTEEGIKETCYGLLEEDWKREKKKFVLQDQDALIFSCRGKVAFFPASWNFSWIQEFSWEQAKCILSPEEEAVYQETLADLKILHFASHFKPWSRPDLPLAPIFWEFARETVFYEEILFREKEQRMTNFDKPFPWHLVDCGSKLVIYGAGVIGRSFLKQISASAYCFVVAVCDQNAKNMKRELFPVVCKENLTSLDFDLILISVEQPSAAQEIRQDLVVRGVPDHKIRWFLEK